MAGMLLAGMYMCVTNPDQIDLHGDPITLASQITTKAMFSFQKKFTVPVTSNLRTRA